MQHLGRSHDAYKGQVASTTSDAASFARAYGFQLSSHYNVDLYGEAGAGVLAQAWVEKAQFFFIYGNSNLTQSMPSQRRTLHHGDLGQNLWNCCKPCRVGLSKGRWLCVIRGRSASEKTTAARTVVYLVVSEPNSNPKRPTTFFFEICCSQGGGGRLELY